LVDNNSHQHPVALLNTKFSGTDLWPFPHPHYVITASGKQVLGHPLLAKLSEQEQA